jgi:hypothetical protein
MVHSWRNSRGPFCLTLMVATCALLAPSLARACAQEAPPRGLPNPSIEMPRNELVHKWRPQWKMKVETAKTFASVTKNL